MGDYKIGYATIIGGKRLAQTAISKYMLRWRSGLRHMCFRKASSKRNVSATLSTRYIAQPISQIEDLVLNPKGNLHVPFSPDIQLLLMQGANHQFESSLHIDKSQLVSIISAVKNLILEWSLKLEELGILGENMSFSSKDIEKAKIASDVTIHNFQGVFGNVNNSNISQSNKLIVNKSDWKSLKKYLESIGIKSEDIVDLEKVLNTEKELASNNEFGPKVNRWIGKMVGKVSTGLWDISTGAAGGILVEVLSKYYGI